MTIAETRLKKKVLDCEKWKKQFNFGQWLLSLKPCELAHGLQIKNSVGLLIIAPIL